MLLDKLAKYLLKVESAIRRLKSVYVERYEEEILTANRINLRIRIRFRQGHLLEINEAVIIEAGMISKLDYRYHFQDKHNKLIFRYDNTPHFPDFHNFPHHKHLPQDVIDSIEPSIIEVIEEAQHIVIIK